MRYLIICLGFTFITLCSISQENGAVKRNRISIGIGSVSPLGDLVSDSIGFAEDGVGFDFDFAISASNNIAFTFGLNRKVFATNEEALNVGGKESVNYDFKVEGSRGKYKLASFFIGAEARTSGKHYFYINPFFGLGKLTTPEITYQTFEVFNSIYTTVSNKVPIWSEVATIYGFKLGANFLLSDHFGIGLFGRFEQGNFRFKEETIVFKPSSNIIFRSLTTGVNLNFSF
jgi:hypothetical protein